MSALCALIAATAGLSVQAGTTPRIDVHFVDPAGTFASYYADLQRSAVGAGLAWTQSIAGDFAAVDLTVSIRFESIATAQGRSASTGFVGTGPAGQTLWQQGAMHELLTGVDVNGAAPDVEFSIGIDGYLQGELWFDPDPLQRLAAVPADRTDAVSVLMHEWGHALGFNGWMDGATGALPGDYASTWDHQIVPHWSDAGLTLMFQGSQAMATYGAAVPLTFDNFAHLGNADGRSGADLIPDLMNGVQFMRGTRYEVSALDLAMLGDMGVPVLAAVPEPAPAVLLVSGLGVVAGLARRRRRGVTAATARSTAQA